MNRIAYMVSLILIITGIAAHLCYAQEVPENYANNAVSVHWVQIETPHFKLVFPKRYEKSFSGTGPMAEKIYREYKNALGMEPDHKISLYFNDEDEVTSAARALHTDDAKSIWKDNIYQQNTAADRQNFKDILRYEIAYDFQKIVQQFPVDYYYLLLSKHNKSPWSDALPSYLAVPQKTPDDVRRMRNYWFTQQMDTHQIYWSKEAKNWPLGRSQIHYFDTLFTPDSLRAMYTYRQSFAGVIHYFNFSPAFERAAGISYDDFSNRWQKMQLKKYRRDESRYDTTSRGKNYPPLAHLPKVHEYIGVQAADSGNEVAAITLPCQGWLWQDLTVLPGDASHSQPVKIDEGSFHPVMAWRPGKDELVYSKELLGDRGNYHYELFADSLQGKRKRQITQNEHAILPAFSPDGRRLAYVSSQGRQHTIRIKNMSNGKELPIYTFGKNTTMELLDWHPAQDVILISYRDEKGSYKAGLLDLQSHRFSMIIPEGSVPLNARWDAGGGSIYFDSINQDVPNIFVGNVSGTSVVNIKPVTNVFLGAELLDVVSDSAGTPHVLGKAPGAFGRDMIKAYPAKGGSGTAATASLFVKENRDSPMANKPKSLQPSSSQYAISPDAYHSFSNIKMLQPFPVPYYISSGDFGLFGYINFNEPLRKQSFEYLGILSLASPLKKSFFHTSYINNMFRPRLELDYNHYPSASEWFGTSRKAKTFDAIGLTSLWKLTGLSHNYSDWYAGVTLRYLAVDYFPEATMRQHHPGIYYENTKTRQTDLRLSLTWRKLKPYRHTIIHPLQAEAVRLQVSASDKILGSQSRYTRFNLDGYKVLPAFGKQRIYIYGDAALDIGNPIGRAYLGFSNNGNYKLPGPDFSGKVNPGVDYFTRGYTTTVLGKQVLFGTLEYRIPLFFDTNKKILRLIPPSRTVVALFADGGILGEARTAANKAKTLYRYSAGVEVKRIFAIGRNFKFVYELGFGQPLDEKLAPHPYVNLKTAIPF